MKDKILQILRRMLKLCSNSIDQEGLDEVFSLLLASRKSSLGDHLFCKYGLLQDCEANSSDSSAAIKRFQLQWKNRLEKVTQEPETGASDEKIFAELGNYSALGLPFRVENTFPDLSRSSLVYAPEYVYTQLESAANKWLDRLEVECITMHAAAKRGLGKTWSVLKPPEDMPMIIGDAKRTQHHIAEWQSYEEMAAGRDVEYSGIARPISFPSALDNLRGYLRRKKISKALVKIPAETLGTESIIERMQYTLLISIERSKPLRRSPEWKDYRQALRQFYGIQGELPEEYVGMYEDIVVIASSLSPLFIEEGRTFTRGLLLGANAIEIGYDNYNCVVQNSPGERIGNFAEAFELRTPYICTSKSDREQVFSMSVATHCGIMKPQSSKSNGSSVRTADSGIVAFDMCEDISDL